MTPLIIEQPFGFFFLTFFLLEQKEPTNSRQTRSLRAFCTAFTRLGADLPLRNAWLLLRALE